MELLTDPLTESLQTTILRETDKPIDEHTAAIT